jgi:hypothetical protein
MRKGLVWTLVVLLVLGVGGYFGDNWLRGYAENRASDAIVAELGDSAGAPSVGLGGFPFALALITRSVPNAHLAVDALPLEISGKNVQLTDVVADTGTVKLGAKEVSVASLTGSARLSYADLSKIADLPVTYATDGRLALKYDQVMFGQQLGLKISALPELDAAAQVIRLTKLKLNLTINQMASDIVLTQEQIDAIVKPIPVTLDHDLRLTSITAREDGVAVGVEGTNLTVPVP